MITTDLAALWSACDELPLDAAPKLILADLLHDAGDESTERAVRWAAARGRWPVWTAKELRNTTVWIPICPTCGSLVVWPGQRTMPRPDGPREDKPIKDSRP